MKWSLPVFVFMATTLAALAAEADWERYHKEGLAAFNSGSYQQAEKSWSEALKEAQRFDANDERLGKTLLNLASVSSMLGKTPEAIPLAERSVQIGEKTLGPNDPKLLKRVDFLSTLYIAQAQYKKAEPLLKRYLSWAEASVPQTEVARVLQNLVIVYRSQARNSEALPVCQKALGIYEKALSADDPHVAACLDSLASLYDSAGKLNQAETAAQRAMGIMEKKFGPNHPNTAAAMATLAEIYMHEGKQQQSETLFMRSLSILQSAGPQYATMAKSVSDRFNLSGKRGSK